MPPILIIDPGHGGQDPGGGSNAYFVEKHKVLEISKYQYERFKQLNVPVALTREQDITLKPTDRVQKVIQSGAKYCISNHINAAVSPSARGVETIHSIFTDGRLAKMLFDEIVSAGMPGRRVFSKKGTDGRDYFFMHRQTGSVITVIVEYGFATNEQDAILLRDHWRIFAEAVVRGFCRFIGHPYQNAQGGDHNQMNIEAEIRKLQQRIAALESMHRIPEVPEWAKDAVEAAVKAGIVDTPNMRSHDFYSFLTVLYRKGLL